MFPLLFLLLSPTYISLPLSFVFYPYFVPAPSSSISILSLLLCILSLFLPLSFVFYPYFVPEPLSSTPILSLLLLTLSLFLPFSFVFYPCSPAPAPGWLSSNKSYLFPLPQITNSHGSQEKLFQNELIEKTHNRTIVCGSLTTTAKLYKGMISHKILD